MNRFLAGTISALALTTLTACGSSSPASSTGNSSSPSVSPTSAQNTGGSGAAAAEAAIKADILANESTSATNPYRMNDAQAGCVANTIVNAIGVDKLHSYGLLTADNKVTTKKFSATRFSVADATVVVDGIFQCVGNSELTSMMKKAIDSSLPATMTAAQRTCIEGKITVSAVKTVLIGEISGNTAAITQLESSVEACMAA